MSNKLKLGLTLFALGLLGVLSLLTVNIPMTNIPKEALMRFSPQMIKFLMLINPMILLIISVLLGIFLHDKVALKVPTISRCLGIDTSGAQFAEQIKYGSILGLCAGLSGIILQYLMKSIMPELSALGKDLTITAFARFGYGGVTEELLMRFGLMTLLVWALSKITKHLSNIIYWIAIILASIVFGLGHLPILFQLISNPSAALLIFVIAANSIAGIFFGWLYWKKGLEAAIIGHIFAHVAMIIFESICS